MAKTKRKGSVGDDLRLLKKHRRILDNTDRLVQDVVLRRLQRHGGIADLEGWPTFTTPEGKRFPVLPHNVNDKQWEALLKTYPRSSEISGTALRKRNMS